MKKFTLFTVTLALILLSLIPAFAEAENTTEAVQTTVASAEETTENSIEKPAEQPVVQENEEPPQDQSQPRFMVTGYKLSSQSVKPCEKATLSVTFKNYSKTKALYNIKLTISDESGELKTQGMPTKYVECIGVGKSYTWDVVIEASSIAQIGEHKLTVNAEYEDKYYNGYSSCDTVSINVIQSVSLEYDGLILPVKVVQGDTQTLTVKLMNTGKTDLRNCKVNFTVDGIESAGTLFIGEIGAGQSADGSANLRVGKDVLGEVKGTAVISYEDAYGEEHTKEVELSTVIEEKAEISDTQSEVEEKSKYPLWWLFLLIGIVVGAGAGVGIVLAIFNQKQRKQDELRL